MLKGSRGIDHRCNGRTFEREVTECNRVGDESPVGTASLALWAVSRPVGGPEELFVMSERASLSMLLRLPSDGARHFVPFRVRDAL
jgi:hypothetical protein